MHGWKYYRRRAGGPVVFEICRFPDNALDLDDQDSTKYPEWLQPDGSWKFYSNDNTLWFDRVKGQFDEGIDELSKEEVDQYYKFWSSEGWPGRIDS